MPLPPERAQRDLALLDRVAVVCIADTNGMHRKLHIPRADVLIHSGGFATTEKGVHTPTYVSVGGGGEGAQEGCKGRHVAPDSLNS